MLRYEEVLLCAHPELPICVGCCGHGFTNIEEIRRDIRSNTFALEDYKKDIVSFRDRCGKDVKQSGICPCVVRKNGVALCAIHPVVMQSDDDLRDGFCNIMFECRTAWEFKRWSDEVKKQFISFVRQNDEIAYSLGIYNGSTLKRFKHEIFKES